MPIFRAFLLSFLFACVNIPGQAQDDPVPFNSNDAPVPAAEESPAEPPVAAQKESLAPPPGTLSLYSPDVLVDMPYIYPLLRMRLTPEMRQEAP